MLEKFDEDSVQVATVVVARRATMRLTMLAFSQPCLCQKPVLTGCPSIRARQMKGLLGWTVTAPEVSVADENTRNDHWEAVGLPTEGTVPFSEEQLHTLLRVNKLDYELMCYAKALREERLAAARATLPIQPFDNASKVAAECRARTVCRCKIFGECGKKHDGTFTTTEPDGRFPLHHKDYYCRVYGLCGDDL